MCDFKSLLGPICLRGSKLGPENLPYEFNNQQEFAMCINDRHSDLTEALLAGFWDHNCGADSPKQFRQK